MSEPESGVALRFAQCALFSLIFLFVAGLAGARAQAGKDHSIIGLHVYVPLEYQSIDAGNLNKYMGVAELPQVKVPSVFLGLGTQIQVDRIVVNLSASRAGKLYQLDNAKLSAPFSTYGFNVGYDLIECPFMNLQPYAGVRVTRMAYKYELRSDVSGTGAAAAGEMAFRGNRGMFDLGIGASLQSDFLAGFRAGVLLPAGRTRWKGSDGAPLTGGPELRYQYYIGINLGLGRANIKVKNHQPADNGAGAGQASAVY